MTRRIIAATSLAVLVVLLTASMAMAGEVTGTGKNLQIDGGKWGTNLHGRSECAFSGQEDLQYFSNDAGNTDPHRVPDLQCAFASGYRVSWQTALIGVPPDLFESNTRAWSGDHCSVDPDLVPASIAFTASVMHW